MQGYSTLHVLTVYAGEELGICLTLHGDTWGSA